jgi:molybdopterin molybdotransferase
VIRREDVEELGASIRLSAAAQQVRPGTAIRRRAQNAPAGATVLESGSELTPAAIGALAAFGAARPLVHRQVRIAVVTTGDELVDAAHAPTPWQLRDSNGPALGALLSRRPWIAAHVHPRAPDEPDALLARFREALDSADALIATGGVSMGDRDFVPSAVGALGGEIIFHKVPQRPGKPVLNALLPGGKLFFGLPGNPISVFVTARRMAVPALERLAGFSRAAPPPLLHVEPDGKRLDLWWYRLVRLTAPGHAALADGQGSGDIPAAAASDGFVEVPPNSEPTRAPFYAWSP